MERIEAQVVPLPAPGGGEKVIVWNEPLCLEPGFVANSVCRATEAEIIKAQKGNFPERSYTDAQALNEFMVVHWAWRESSPDTDTAGLVERLKARSVDLYGLACSDFEESNPLTGEAFDADGRRIVEGSIALDDAVVVLQHLSAERDARTKQLADRNCQLAAANARIAQLERDLNETHARIVSDGEEYGKHVARLEATLTKVLPEIERLEFVAASADDGNPPRLKELRNMLSATRAALTQEQG